MATHSSSLVWGIHGQRSLAGYSPRGGEESETPERLTTSLGICAAIFMPLCCRKSISRNLRKPLFMFWVLLSAPMRSRSGFTRLNLVSVSYSTGKMKNLDDDLKVLFQSKEFIIFLNL